MNNTVKVTIGVLLVFVLGILAGAFGTQVFLKYRTSHFVQRGPEARAERFLEHLSRDLDLTDDQRAEIGTIVRESHRRLAEISRRCRPEIRGIIEGDFEKIRRILTDEQRQKFDQFQKRFHQRGTHRKFDRPPPPRN